MGASNYLKNKLLDHLLGATVYTAPATLYLALYTIAPGDGGGGTQVTGGSYVRLAVTNNSTNFDPAVAGSKSNKALLALVTSTANWGTVVAYGFFDASTSGNLLTWALLNSARVMVSGDVLRFPAGSLVFSFV